MNLAALVVGSTLMGPLGMVIAIPLCAALKGLFVFYFEKETGVPRFLRWRHLPGNAVPRRDGAPVPAFDALGDDSFVAESELISDDVTLTGEAVPRLLSLRTHGASSPSFIVLAISDAIPPLLPHPSLGDCMSLRRLHETSLAHQSPSREQSGLESGRFLSTR